MSCASLSILPAQSRLPVTFDLSGVPRQSSPYPQSGVSDVLFSLPCLPVLSRP